MPSQLELIRDYRERQRKSLQESGVYDRLANEQEETRKAAAIRKQLGTPVTAAGTPLPPMTPATKPKRVGTSADQVPRPKPVATAALEAEAAPAPKPKRKSITITRGGEDVAPEAMEPGTIKVSRGRRKRDTGGMEE